MALLANDVSVASCITSFAVLERCFEMAGAINTFIEMKIFIILVLRKIKV
jgi:hypothetical protein